MRHGFIDRLGLGTAQFGGAYGVSNKIGRVPYRDVAAIIEVADGAGITMIDTAPAYGDAEKILGDTIPHDATFQLTTKTISLSHGVSAVLARFHRSLELLRTSSVDTLLVHSAAELNGPDGPDLWRALQRLRECGLCQRVGFSAYFDDEPLSLARRYPDANAIQLPISFLDQRLLMNGTIAQLKNMGVVVQARSIFLQGAIFLREHTLVKTFGRSGLQLSQIFIRLLREGVTPVSAALGFVLAHPEIDLSIVGVTSAAEISEITNQAASAPLDLPWSSYAVQDPFLLSPFLWTAKDPSRL